MDDLMVLNGVKTMDSREIAELTGKDLAKSLGMSLPDLKACFPAKSKTGDVYLLKNPTTELVKIGRSGNLAHRKRVLETGAGTELICIGWVKAKDSFALETNLHARFQLNRQNGEWYRLNEEDIRTALEIMEALK